MSLVLLSVLLALSVSASPTPLGNLQSRAQAPSLPIHILTQGNLSAYPSEPWGPPEFSVDFASMHVPINKEAFFMIAISMVRELAVLDWNSRLPQGRVEFTLHRYPDLAISVKSLQIGNPLQRKYVLWGMARAMNQMIQARHLLSSIFQLKWRGQVLGSIFVIQKRAQVDADYTVTNMTETAKEPKDVPAVSVGAGVVSWDFEYTRKELIMNDVVMGAIGAMVQAAELPNQNLNEFVGSFPQYNAFYLFTVSYSVEPSAFNKTILIRSIKATVEHMILIEHAYREVRVGVKLNNQIIARGSCFPVEGSLNTATSRL